MASRWMQAKLAIMKRQQRPFAPSDTLTRRGHSLAASAVKQAEITKLCDGYTGVVLRAEPSRKVEPVGKTQRRFDRSVGTRGGAVRQLQLVDWNEAQRFTLVKRQG